MVDTADGGAPLTLMLCGDINLQDRADPRSAFARVKDDLARADVVFGDLEMCLYEPSSRIVDKPGWQQSEARMVDGLVDAGFDVLSCANNVNHGDEAILATVAVLDRAGIAHTGSGANLIAARTPAIVERGGVTIGFLAYTAVFFPHGHAAGPESPGVSTIRCHTAYEPHPRVYELPGAPAITRSWPDPTALEALAADLAALRSRVDVLVTYFHWGVSGMDDLAEYQRLVAHHVIDRGADLVVGSHAHVPQAVEVHRGRAILYGLGNFAFDWVKMRPHRTGLIAECLVADRRIQRVAIRPVWRHDDDLNQPDILPLDDPRGRRIVERVVQSSQGRGALLTEVDDALVVLDEAQSG